MTSAVGRTPGAGSVRVASEVVAAIVATTALEVPGVAGMCDPAGAAVARFPHHHSARRGVKLQMVGLSGVRLDLYLAIGPAAALPVLTEEVTRRVREAIGTMLGLEVVELDLHIRELVGD